MEPDGSGLISGAIGALTAIMGWGDGVPPVSPTDPMPGGAVVALQVGEDDFIIHPDQVASVQALVDERTRAPHVLLILTADAAQRFGQITAAHIGDPMDLSVCGDVLMSPVIQEAITGGQIMIAGGFTIEETTELANIIAGDAPCSSNQNDSDQK